MPDAHFDIRSCQVLPAPQQPEMALRLSKAIGRTPESWLAMQDAHDLWAARKSVNLQRVDKLKLAVA